MLDDLRRHHGTHVAPSRRIADVACPASNQSDRFISGILKPLHETERHKMPYVKAVCRRIESNVKCRLAVIDQLPYLLFVRHLSDQASCLQLLINPHFFLLLFS